MTSRLTRGPKPTGPFPNPGRHSCVTDTKFRSNKIIIRINHREGRSPHTRNRSLILHSVAEQNGVSIPERGRHHPSGIAAPRRAELASGGVCRFFVMSFFVTKPPKETPENHLTSGHRVAPEMFSCPARGTHLSTQTRKVLARLGPVFGRIGTYKGHRARSKKRRLRSF